MINYKTKLTLLGLPLVHVTTGKVDNERYKRGIAKGWIAVGDISFGVIISVGGVAFGGIAVGGLAVGLLSFAGLAVGVFALGGGAIGVLASGGVAAAWKAAFGGFAVANEYAQGGLAIANHTGDQIANNYFENSLFFSFAKLIAEHSRWFLLLLAFPIGQNMIRWMKQRREKS
ncbi:MAG: hypothetical protein ABIF87_08295 [Pseudomonadota bacterium]